MKLILVLCLLSSLNAVAKKSDSTGGGPVLEPLMRDGMLYSYTKETMNEGCPTSQREMCGIRVFILAQGTSRGPAEWRTELYRVKFEFKREDEKQEIVPVSLTFKNKNEIELVDSRGAHYVVNSKEGALVSPDKIKIYDNSKK